jgi:hypothetical protein
MGYVAQVESCLDRVLAPDVSVEKRLRERCGVAQAES